MFASGTTGFHYPKAKSGKRSGARSGSTSGGTSTTAPSTSRSTGSTGGAPSVGNPTGGGGATSDPGGTVDDTVKKVTGGGTPPPAQPVVDTIDSIAEATSFCSAQLAGITSDGTVISKCAERVNGKAKTEAAAMIPNSLSAVLSWLGLPALPGTGGGGLLN